MGAPPQNRPCRVDRGAVGRGGPRAWGRPTAEEIFAAAGLSYPDPRIATDSIILRARLIAGSPYLGLFLTSVLRRLIADNYALTALPVDLHANTQSIAVVTLNNRTLSPVVERFLICVREVAASFAPKPGSRAARSPKAKVYQGQARKNSQGA